MGSKSSWAKVKSDMHDDEKIENIACVYGPRTLAYWIVFICESKKVHRTRDGWSGPWTLTQFAAKCYDEKSTKKSVRELVESFVQEGLLEVTGELLGRWRARPSMFVALQEQGDNAVRKENSRDFLQGKDSNGHVFGTNKNAKNNQKKGPRIETERENENEKNLDIGLVKKSATESSNLPILETPNGIEEALPSTRQTIRNQTIQAKKRLGKLFPVVERLYQMADSGFTDRQVLDWYLRPALQSVADYGTQEVHDAMMEAHKNKAYRWAYVQRVLEVAQNNRLASQSSTLAANPLSKRLSVEPDDYIQRIQDQLDANRLKEGLQVMSEGGAA